MAKVKFTTTIDEEVLQWLKIQAIKEKRSASSLIEEMIKHEQEKSQTTIVSTPG